jgi:putative alpha-1,2-mannosidase
VGYKRRELIIRLGSGSGNVFAGVSQPMGIVKLGMLCSPESLTPGPDPDNLAGDLVAAISMTHETGTGGGQKYGVVAQMPVLGDISNPLQNISTAKTKADTAYVGYYVTTFNGVSVELAATQRAGLYRYNFTDTTSTKNIVVDMSHYLIDNNGGVENQNYSWGGIQTFSDGHYEANGTYAGGWNEGMSRWYC